MIRSRELKLCEAFEFAHAQPERDVFMHALYENLPVSDLSSQVWAASPERLGVVCLGEVGWSDLGNPGRLIDVLSRNGEKNERPPIWRKRPESRTRGSGADAGVRPTCYTKSVYLVFFEASAKIDFDMLLTTFASLRAVS